MKSVNIGNLFMSKGRLWPIQRGENEFTKWGFTINHAKFPNMHMAWARRPVRFIDGTWIKAPVGIYIALSHKYRFAKFF